MTEPDRSAPPPFDKRKKAHAEEVSIDELPQHLRDAIASREDRSAPLSVEQTATALWRMVLGPLPNVFKVAEIAAALRAADAVGERRGRQQALEEAAARMNDSESETWTREEVRDWLLFRATRGDEAHHDTSLLPRTTGAKENS